MNSTDKALENLNPGSTPSDQHSKILLSPGIRTLSPEVFMTNVQNMYSKRVTSKTKKVQPAPGLTVSRTKKGALSIRLSKTRAFKYVLDSEISALAKELEAKFSEVWEAFKSRDFIITKTRMQAEQVYSAMKSSE